jgi:cardiolipin synthase
VTLTCNCAARWWQSSRNYSWQPGPSKRPGIGAQQLFSATWQSRYDLVRAIGSSPDDPVSLIYATLLSAIGSAGSSIHLTSAYFVPDPQLLAALEAAVARGVRVTLILPGKRIPG